MTASTRESSRTRDPSLPRVVAATCVFGVLALVLVFLLDTNPLQPAVSVSLSHRWLVPLLLLATTAGELTAVRLRHGEETEELTLFEAAVLADALLLRPREAIVVTLVGLVLASLATRRQLIKIAFNTGAYAVATTALLGCVVGLADPTDRFGAGTVAGLVLGTTAFATINLVALSLVLRAATGVPAMATVRESWRLSAIMAVGTAAVGATTVAVATSAPLLLPFSLLPAAALTYAYSAVAQESHQRLRSEQLLALGQLLAGPVGVEDLVTSFLAYVREAFRAETAFIVMETAGREETLVIAHEGGVDVRSASGSERLLLATVERTSLLPAVALQGGQRRVLASPLESESRRMGVLALTEAPAQRTLLTRRTGSGGRDARLGTAELNLIGSLAAALAAALRGAEHLSRSQEETAKLKAVVTDSSDGIVVLDQGSRVTVWNPSMEALTGIQERAALGQTLVSLVTVTDSEGAPTDLLTTAWEELTPEQPRAIHETGLLRGDGEQRWVRWAHAAVFDESDPAATGSGPLRDVVLVHDMTRKRQVERLKQDFLATVSHELRSPLTPIKGYVDLLRRKGEDFTPEKRQEFLDVVNDRVAHLARLVEDVLLASRVTVPASTVQMGSADLVALATKSIGDFSIERERLHIDLPTHPLPVACDPVRVVQVMSNLVSNALKYSPSSSPVFVVLRSDQGKAQISVSDRGRGIPSDQLDAIFEKFHRIEDPMHMTTGGTGLGLYIAKQLTEAMNGELTVNSTFGVGSTFIFSLPLLAENADDGAGPTMTAPRSKYARPAFPTPRQGERSARA